MLKNVVNLIKIMNEQRDLCGFLSIEKTALLCKQENIVLDLFSVLISKTVEIGSGNIFYPNVIIETKKAGQIIIGENNVFHSNTFLLAEQGSISIGNNNQFGDGGLSVKANMPDSKITIESNGRYLNGAQLLGHSFLGSGSQVIGHITVQNCRLESGKSYLHDNPNERAGLLKGFGLAKNLIVASGKVIDGAGVFNQKQIKSQSFYHAK